MECSSREPYLRVILMLRMYNGRARGISTNTAGVARPLVPLSPKPSLHVSDHPHCSRRLWISVELRTADLS